MEKTIQYPFKDLEFGFWVYDEIPEGMVLLEPSKIKLGQRILYRSNGLVYVGLFLSDVVSLKNLGIVRTLASQGSVWVTVG